MRNPVVEWDEEAEGADVELTVPRRQTRGVNVAAWLVGVPDQRKLVLDEMGAFVWRLCDGEHSVEEIAKALMAEYKLSQREATVSLTTYLRTLGRRNLVAFAIDKELLDEDEGEDENEEEGSEAEEKSQPTPPPEGPDGRGTGGADDE